MSCCTTWSFNRPVMANDWPGLRSIERLICRVTIAGTVVVEEDRLAVVAPLSEVVRFAHRHHPRESGHRVVDTLP